MNLQSPRKGDKTMEGTARLNRSSLSSPRPHHVRFAFVFTAVLLATSTARVIGADKAALAAITQSNTDTNLDLLLQDEDFWVIEDEPVNHLAHVAEALDRHDPKAAARELRLAAFFVKAHAARAEGASRSDLQADATKLEHLAGRVEQGVVKSQDELASTLANTYLHLARYHYLAAVKEQANDDLRGAKHDLTKAADYVEKHLQVAGGTIDHATQRLLADARRVGQTVESVTDQSKADTGRVLESLGGKIQDLGRDLAGNTKGEQMGAPAATHNVAQQTQPKPQP
jgi:hypothetical protein